MARMSPMRVLMISKACVVGIYQRKLEEIARRNVDLLVLVPPSWRDERGEMRLERVYTTGYRLETVPIILNGDFHLHFYQRIGAWMESFRPDIVHIDEEPYNVAAWQALYHARRVGAKTLFFSWQNLIRRYPPPFSWGERWMLRTVDYVIAGTESAAQVWRTKGYRGPLEVIAQFGTDPDLFHPAAERPADRPFTVGYIGRLVEEKGVQVLIDALAQMDGAARLLVVGGGPERKRLGERAAARGLDGRVEFVPQIASMEMPAVYHRLDVLALPSLTRPNWKEQFGRVLVEAMASGVPVVGSDSGAIPDVIGDAGLIVPEGDAAALAAALTRLRDDLALRSALQAKGRERALARFTHASVAEATVRVYAELCAEKQAERQRETLPEKT